MTILWIDLGNMPSRLMTIALKLGAAVATLVVLTIGGARKGGAHEQPSPGWITLLAGHSQTFHIDNLTSGELYAVSIYAAGLPRGLDQPDLMVSISDEQGELSDRTLDTEDRYLDGIAQPRRCGRLYINLSAGA